MISNNSHTSGTPGKCTEGIGCCHFACPQCKNAPLGFSQDSASCGSCGAAFDIVDGVIDFSHGTSGTTSTKRDYDKTLQRLLDSTKARGWLKALQENLPENSAEYATDARKSDFVYLIELKQQDRALDLGCGLGPITISLAEEFEEVHALDAILDQAQFVKQRALQSGLTNVFCCSAPPGGVLPYQDETFDLVVMSGVIEWVATARGMNDISPLECQRRILLEANRVLRSGGLLYLTTKNRFALRYLMGQKDEHTGLPFTSLMPPSWVNGIQQWRAAEEYRTRLHSKRSLRNVLADAGFAEIDLWALLPSFRSPSCYVRLGDRDALRTVRKRRLGFARLMRRERLVFSLLPSRAISAFTYCIAALARKD